MTSHCERNRPLLRERSASDEAASGFLTASFAGSLASWVSAASLDGVALPMLAARQPGVPAEP